MEENRASEEDGEEDSEEDSEDNNNEESEDSRNTGEIDINKEEEDAYEDVVLNYDARNFDGNEGINVLANNTCWINLFMYYLGSTANICW